MNSWRYGKQRQFNSPELPFWRSDIYLFVLFLSNRFTHFKRRHVRRKLLLEVCWSNIIQIERNVGHWVTIPMHRYNLLPSLTKPRGCKTGWIFGSPELFMKFFLLLLHSRKKNYVAKHCVVKEKNYVTTCYIDLINKLRYEMFMSYFTRCLPALHIWSHTSRSLDKKPSAEDVNVFVYTVCDEKRNRVKD